MIAADINTAVSLLRQGKLIGLPTETVYGLAADAKNLLAVKKVFAAKGRPVDHPLIVHIGRVEELSKWARDIPPEAYRLAKQYWPGPLTLVLQKQDWVLPEVTGGQDTVAIRMPNHPLALELLRAFGSGLVAPSANQFGRISPTDEAAVLAELADKVDLILPGGRSTIGIESTILDLHQKPYTLLRQGMLSQAELENFLGEPILLPSEKTTVRVPGLLASHYSPRTPLKLFDLKELNRFEKQCVMVILCDSTPEVYAHELYAALRAADQGQYDLILVERPPQTPEWVAIQDRLKRAASVA